MAAITRLSLDGYGARRAGSFAGKASGAGSGNHNPGTITRLSLDGYGAQRVGSFAGKEPETPSGAGTHNPGTITRLSLDGYGVGRVGSFAGKELSGIVIPPEVLVRRGGTSGFVRIVYRKRKLPEYRRRPVLFRPPPLEPITPIRIGNNDVFDDIISELIRVLAQLEGSYIVSSSGARSAVEIEPRLIPELTEDEEMFIMINWEDFL